MHGCMPADGILYHVEDIGRLSSEMVIKAVEMGIPVLISRSGTTRGATLVA